MFFLTGELLSGFRKNDGAWGDRSCAVQGQRVGLRHPGFVAAPSLSHLGDRCSGDCFTGGPEWLVQGRQLAQSRTGCTYAWHPVCKPPQNPKGRETGVPV